MPHLVRLILCLSLASSAYATDTLGQAWQEAAAGLVGDAHKYFITQSGPEAELGQALSFLVIQPKTNANLDRATELLTELSKRPVTDEISQAARYYLARIAHMHRQRVDLPGAKAIYDALIADAPDSFYGSLAQVKVAMIDLYDPKASNQELRARFDRLIPVAKAIADKSARRDLSIILADTALYFEYGDDQALALLLQANQAGITQSAAQADILVRIGELARLTGKPALAREYYQRLLDTFPRDRRRLMVMENLASLPTAK